MATDSPSPAAAKADPPAGPAVRPLPDRLRPQSLAARQTWAVTLGLFAFLVITGLALDRAFRDVASRALSEQLENYAYDYVGRINFDRQGVLIAPESSPDPRFERPGGGLYAQVVMESGLAWASPSARGPRLPDPHPMLADAAKVMEGPLPMQHSDGSAGSVIRFGWGLVDMDASDRATQAPVRYTLYVMEDGGNLPQQVAVFRRALWVYLGAGALLLLLLQGSILRWSLLPLRKVVAELRRVQRGETQRMSAHHPRELATLTDSINALIDSERENLERQRNLLADLAHSLKTPLAVLRTRLDEGGDANALRDELDTQLRRMNDIVSYQLTRAAASGHKLYSAPIAVLPYAEQIVQGLEKIHARRGVLCEFEIDPAARFHGEPGDLQEILGNLLENAFKWAGHRVLLTVQVQSTAPVAGRPPLSAPPTHLLLQVEDDGPGIPADQVAHVLQRGVRGDERVQGHGIGLAIVQDIVESYRGQLAVAVSEELGGARVRVLLPQGHGG